MEKGKKYLFDNKTLAKLIFPLLVEQLLAVLVGLADSIMVASVGEAAVSGVSLVDNIMVLFINLFAALATGGAVIAGQYLGQEDEKSSGKAATQLMWFIAASSLVIMVIIYLGKGFILHQVFGAIDDDVRRHADIYLMIVTASIPFIAIYNGGAAVFRAMGNSGVSMRVSIIMNVINCTGNAILIYGFHRGTEGVAIPTLISRFVAALLILIMLVKTKGPIRVTPSLHFRFDGRMVRRILRIGLPNGMENSMFQLGKILVLSLVSTFGTSAIAANILIFVSLPFIMEIYHLTPQTAATTELLLRFHTICCILIWPLSFSLPCTLRAAGDTKVTMWICRIVMSYVLGAYMGMGVFGIWVAMVLDWCVRTVFMLYRYRTGKWKLIDSIG